MPLYVFKCRHCDHQIEVLQKYTEPAPACCKCKSETMDRQVARTTFKLNGQGWAVDGYAKR
jgi:putative FmdB family regulatory protein